MPRVLLYNGGGITQQFANSCWAACTRFMNNYYVEQGAPGIPFHTDQAMAAALHMAPNGEAAMTQVLTQAHMHDGHDSEYFPQFAEVQAEINAGRMLCACVSPTRHGYLCQDEITGGHYVVIIGYDTAGPRICVMDPANGSIRWLTYDGTKYVDSAGNTVYWCGTDYTNGQAAH